LGKSIRWKLSGAPKCSMTNAFMVNVFIIRSDAISLFLIF
jgi:hypothetical protein